MRSRDDRRAAGILLVLALAGLGVRLLASGGAPGEVAYREAAVSRPERESLAVRAARLSRPLSPGERVDLDGAPAEELARLPRIGPALAARIVADRESRGPFGSLEALDRVSGIGPATLEALRPYAAFSAAPASAAGSAAGGPGEGEGRLVSLNTATAAELAQLPGIGPVRAHAILEDRRRRGPYRRLEDLTRVPGIGPATVARLRGWVRLP